LESKLGLLYQKYRKNGGVELPVQTTGDLATDKIVDGLRQPQMERTRCDSPISVAFV
jgi:hypothetical protein